MNKNEKSFQNYFMSIARPLNYYRISLVNGAGFPDIVGFHGEQHSLVELKDLILGKRGDRLLKQYFESTQPPWYLDYFERGGCRLFVAFKIRDSQDSSKWYGLLQLSKEIVLKLIRNELKYSDLKNESEYEEYDTCKEMIMDIEGWRGLS